MRIAAFWRYPVKSLAGEVRDALDVDARGVEHDRAWAFVDPDGAIASGKTARRFRKVPGLLCRRSRLDGAGPRPSAARVTSPVICTGNVTRPLRAAVRVRLLRARPADSFAA